jgi:hypothetical protein
MCESGEVYSIPGGYFSSKGWNITILDEEGEERLEFYFQPYVCMNCGFTSMYVGNMDDIKDLPRTEGWKKVQN